MALVLNSSSITGLTSGGLYAPGHVIQVVNASINTYLSTTSSTFIDTGLTATITPTSASSKILVLMDHAGCSKETASTGLRIKVLRSGTQIVYIADIDGYNASSSTNFIGSISCNYLDSPSTTSAIIYKSQFSSSLNTGLVSIGNYNATAVYSTITLMEIAA
jgi:hypothetical protein